MNLQRGKPSQGISLGTVLLVIVIIATVALAMGSLSTYHLNLSNRAANAEHARNLAESMLSVAMERVLKNQDYGTTRDPEETLEYRPPGGPEDAVGRVTFDLDTAASLGIPYSTNNLKLEGSTEGWNGQVVPGAAAHLVATGVYNGVTRQVECILYIPRYPYVISTSGRFESSGGLLVAGVSELDDLAGGVPAVNPEDLLPGHIVSNATGAQALVLGPDTEVTGDVQSSGDIETDPTGTQILGEIRKFAEPAQIPRLKVSDYDPQALGKPGLQVLDQPLLEAPAFEGWVRHPSSLQVTGGLTLDGAVLYVAGNLDVTGGVKGTGALLVEGNTTIAGGASFTTDNQVALLSVGDVRLAGDGKENSYFQGLMYTEGDFQADHISLVGTFIANGEGSSMTITDASLVHVPQLTSFTVTSSTLLVFKKGKFQGTGEDRIKPGDETKRSGPRGIQVTRVEDGTYRVTARNVTVTASTLEQAMKAIESELFIHDAKPWVLKQTEKDKVLEVLSSLEERKVENEEEFTIDPSRFLKLEDQARLLMYREL
ncbi:MAG: hypothetical protein HY319_07165 [Armatimonadetes bacterium]|nr:hypothetical protein [Armatimonadota bacterium]